MSFNSHIVCLLSFVGYLTPWQHASASLGRHTKWSLLTLVHIIIIIIILIIIVVVVTVYCCWYNYYNHHHHYINQLSWVKSRQPEVTEEMTWLAWPVKRTSFHMTAVTRLLLCMTMSLGQESGSTATWVLPVSPLYHLYPSNLSSTYGQLFLAL